MSNWLVEVAEAEGYLAQCTSVPGVAQRTGATIYYLEFFPRRAAEQAGRDPVMALMPVPGDVDCVVASELVEAGRAIQRGLVVPRRTVLIASSHRAYTISERSEPGDGRADHAALCDLARERAKRLILFDMAAIAERHDCMISSVLLGVLAASGALPFHREAFEAAIRRSGIAVKTNLAAFADAYEQAAQGAPAPLRAASRPRLATEIPSLAGAPALQAILDRLRCLPPALQPLVLEGIRRSIDYQDPAYAALYLKRVERIVRIDERCRGIEDAGTLAESVARSLALWMNFEDTIRVADLKTRARRFDTVRAEVRATPGQIVGITEFVKPRVAEIAGTLPVSMGRRLRRSSTLARWLARLTPGRKVRTTTVAGFLALRFVAGLKRWRRGTLRFSEENERIEQWLADIARLASRNYSLAVEVARSQRLVKGYGETHERGWKHFSILQSRLDELAVREDGAMLLARLQAAALADEEGHAFAQEMALLCPQPLPARSGHGFNRDVAST